MSVRSSEIYAPARSERLDLTQSRPQAEVDLILTIGSAVVSCSCVTFHRADHHAAAAPPRRSQRLHCQDTLQYVGWTIGNPHLPRDLVGV